jgi:hypothetical protein
MTFSRISGHCRRIPVVYAGLLLFLIPRYALAEDPSANEHVKLEVRPSARVMRSGTGGEIQLHFSPADGIHVNADPPIVLSLDSAAGVRLKGKPIMTMDGKTGYLSTEAPVRQKFTLLRGVKRGPLNIKATVIFMYCSDSEGWCNRGKQPVEFTITVR